MSVIMRLLVEAERQKVVCTEGIDYSQGAFPGGYFGDRITCIESELQDNMPLLGASG